MTTGHTDTLTGPRPTGYAFNNSSPQAPDQLATLEAYLDRVPTPRAVTRTAHDRMEDRLP